MKTYFIFFLSVVLTFQLDAQTIQSDQRTRLYKWDQSYFSTKFDFEPSDTFNPNNNYLLAQLALLVYAKKRSIKKQVDVWNSDLVGSQMEFTVKNTCRNRFMILSTPDWMIVCFRGTNNLHNILSDLDMKLVEFHPQQGKVHRGFRRIMNHMENPLKKAIGDHYDNNQAVYTTGHSLGAGIALLAPLFFDFLADSAQITTYGQPKVGNDTLARFVMQKTQTDRLAKGRYFRIVNQSDFVAQLPIFDYSWRKNKYRFYRHAGAKYIYSPEANAYYSLVETGCDPSEYPEPAQSTNQENRFPFHSMELYLKHAFANRENSPYESVSKSKE